MNIFLQKPIVNFKNLPAIANCEAIKKGVSAAAAFSLSILVKSNQN